MTTWPNKSLNNGFTLGYTGTPHGYDPEKPIAPSKRPPPKRKPAEPVTIVNKKQA